MTLGVLAEIVAVARHGYFVRDVQYKGAEDEYHVTYDKLSNSGPETVAYKANGTVVSNHPAPSESLLKGIASLMRMG